MKKNEGIITVEEKKHLLRLEAINKGWKKGDDSLIAVMCECTSDYVAMVLRNDRKSERILQAAEAVIENREYLIFKFKKR